MQKEDRQVSVNLPPRKERGVAPSVQTISVKKMSQGMHRSCDISLKEQCVLLKKSYHVINCVMSCYQSCLFVVQINQIHLLTIDITATYAMYYPFTEHVSDE